MAKRTVHTPLELDTQGVSLTDFAQAICLQEHLEVSLVRLHVTVQQVTFPLCLVAASCLRPPVRPRLGDIPAWPLRQIPDALFQCSVDMPSGLTLWPFADDPHITQEGFILHGPSAEIRAKVYRFLLQREIPSNVAPSVREHLEWRHENGSLIKIFTFRSPEHLTLQAFPPPAKRRAAAHISPQPAFTGVLPEPPVFTIYQEEPTCQCGVYAAQAARPPALEERSGLQNSTEVARLYTPTKFQVEGFSAGSYTGATFVIALCHLFPACPVSATLGAIAMPKGIMGALMELASPGHCDIHLVHAEEDLLCDWHPSPTDRKVIEYRLRCTLVAEADKWMGADKHRYWHWLHCSLPEGRWLPDVIPIRDRMAAPLRLASWIRFETVANQQDWRTAIEQLVPQIHLPDPALLDLLRSCVPEQGISSMAQAQALLLCNFRVGSSEPNACEQWLTEVTRDLFKPIPFREVFVILALFLPQLTFAEGAKLDCKLWYSPATILSLAEVGTTVSADHLLQMATMPLEHKPTALGIPYALPVSYQFEGAEELLRSLHALFGLLATANTPQYCPQASGFGKQLCAAAGTDSAHIMSIALSMVSALQSGRSTLAIAGVFGAGKTRSLTFLLAWFAITTNLRFGVARKENPAGRAITKLLSSLDLNEDQQTLFIRPVGKEEATANTASTKYDKAMFHSTGLIPGARVVVTTTGLIWEQKGQAHSSLRMHMESVDVLVSEEAQQDMNLKSAFVPAVPRQPFFRTLLGDPRQSPGGVADNL